MTIPIDNQYTTMQRDFYNSTADIMAIENHGGHNANPDYWDILLDGMLISPSKWDGKTALDFGCGIGRNVHNLLKSANWDRVDGCDISSENVRLAGDYLHSQGHDSEKYSLYTTDGVGLRPIQENRYDFVMSTIVLQHIPIYDIRHQILLDIHSMLNTDGLFSFQMIRYHNKSLPFARYSDNIWSANATNGGYDISVDDPNDVINELQKIGYKNVEVVMRPEWDASKKQYTSTAESEWLFFKAFK